MLMRDHVILLGNLNGISGCRLREVRLNLHFRGNYGHRLLTTKFVELIVNPNIQYKRKISVTIVSLVRKIP